MPRSVFVWSVVLLLTQSCVAGAQPTLAIVEDAPAAPLRDHLKLLLEALAKRRAPLPAETTKALQQLLRDPPRDEFAFTSEVQKLLDPHCLIGVTINPESRVKAARGPAPAALQLNHWGVMLVKIHNDAGVTHALTVAGDHLRQSRESAVGSWLTASVHASPPLGKTLSGQKLEYVILVLLPHESGKREATLKFDVGQGTQDLGFRAEVPVLFRVAD